jgi:hypothetical protein
MIDLGKGVSVDFLDRPYVFGIEGWDPIRIQKGTGRITGVSLEQLELIVKTIKGVKNATANNTGDAVKTTTRKNRTTSRTGGRSTKGNGHIPK